MKILIFTILGIRTVWSQDQFTWPQFLFLLLVQNPLVAFYWDQVAIYLFLNWATVLGKRGFRFLHGAIHKRCHSLSRSCE